MILDEAAFIERIDVIWTAAQQTLATGGDCLAISTPNGVGNWFHKTWVDATDGLNKFNTVKLHWSEHPERDKNWRNEQNTILGPTKAAQECDADFLSSGQSVVDPKILEWYKENMCCEPTEKSGIDRNLWIWDYPDYSKQYLICADVARGDATDYSAAQVFELESLTQVAEYKGQLGTTEFGNFLIELSFIKGTSPYKINIFVFFKTYFFAEYTASAVPLGLFCKTILHLLKLLLKNSMLSLLQTITTFSLDIFCAIEKT